jgi:hypothetical protein
MTILKPEQYRTNEGVIRTRSLFYELSYTSEFAVFTIKDRPTSSPITGPLIEFRKIFVEYHIQDPTEVSFADHMFGSWQAWSKIRSSDKRIVALLDECRQEADVRRKAIAFTTVLETATSDKASAFTAAKYLIEGSWDTTKAGKDGRSKRQRDRDTANEAFNRSGIEDDLQRLKDNGLIQ